MLTLVLGLSGALTYGTADFFGGTASKRIGSMRTALISAAIGLVAMTVAIPIFGARFSAATLVWASLSGAAGMVGLSLLYACLAIGPMSILSPLTALVSAVVPLLAGVFINGETFSTFGGIGIVVGLIAVVLVGFVPERNAARPRPRSLVMAVGSGIGIGLYLVCIDRTPASDGVAPLLINRASEGVLLVIAVVVASLVLRSGHTGWRSGLPFAAVCGLLDVGANAMFLLALRTGELSVVAVLNALYPVGTIIIASIVLHERVAKVQAVGLILVIVASMFIAFN